MRLAPVLLLFLLLAPAAPAAAQETVDIGDPAAAAFAPIRADGERIGRLAVQRIGSSIVATARLTRRPTGRVRLCVRIEGERRCVSRSARRVVLRHQADFVAPLRAVVRGAGARGAVTL